MSILPHPFAARARVLGAKPAGRRDVIPIRDEESGEDLGEYVIGRDELLELARRCDRVRVVVRRYPSGEVHLVVLTRALSLAEGRP